MAGGDIDAMGDPSAFENTHEYAVIERAHPDGTFLVQADAVGPIIAQIGEQPSVGQRPVRGDIEGRQPVPEGLSDD